MAARYVSERRGLFMGMLHLKMRKKFECNQLVMISSIRRDTCFESKGTHSKLLQFFETYFSKSNQ